MKVSSIGSMNFKGIYQAQGTKKESKTVNSVPVDKETKGNTELIFADYTYRPFKDEVVDKKKVEADAPGILVKHYWALDEGYFATAIVPKITVGKTLNCTQDEWERVNEDKTTSTIPKNSLSKYATIYDNNPTIRNLTAEEAEEIRKNN